jgi:hypothetical protein
MGRDVLRAVGRFTDHLEPSEATVGTAGWAGGILGGMGIAAGLYFASQSAAAKGDSQGVTGARNVPRDTGRAARGRAGDRSVRRAENGHREARA